MRTAALLAFLAAAGSARAEFASFEYFVAGTIPDDSILGIQNTQSVAGVTGAIEDLRLSLALTPIGADGGWMGDLYAYLRHTDESGTTTSILMNRVGRQVGRSAGLSAGPSIDIMFDDVGPDVHLLAGPQGELLTGTFSADGRAIDPALALDTAARTAGLDLFTGGNANGEWTLFIADMSGGSQYRLDSWGLVFQTAEVTDPEPEPVPEVSSIALTSLLVGALALSRRRR